MLDGLLDGLKRDRDIRAQVLHRRALSAEDLMGVGELSEEQAERALTRIQEGEESVPVLLVRSFDAVSRSFVTLTGVLIDLNGPYKKREVLVSMLGCTVQVKASKAPMTMISDVSFLSDLVFLGSKEEGAPSKFRIGVVDRGEVKDIRGYSLECSARYSSQTGYTYTTKRRF